MLAESDLTLDKAVKICRASECARTNSASLRDGTVQPISAYRRSRSARRPRPTANRDWRRRSSSGSNGGRDSRSPSQPDRGSSRPADYGGEKYRRARSSDQERDDPPCGRCGRRRHPLAEQCAARQAVCFQCGVTGHFMRVCSNRTGRRGPGPAVRGRSSPAGRRSVRPVVADVRVKSVSDRRFVCRRGTAVIIIIYI